MSIVNPTNDQIVNMIKHNRDSGQCTRISYGVGRWVWIYTTNIIYLGTDSFTGEISIDELIRLMEQNQAKEVS